MQRVSRSLANLEKAKCQFLVWKMSETQTEQQQTGVDSQNTRRNACKTLRISKNLAKLSETELSEI